MILPTSRQTVQHMAREVLRPRAGSRCPKGCGGYLRVGNSRECGTVRVQYLVCGNPDCKHRPENNKVIRPAEEIRRRA